MCDRCEVQVYAGAPVRRRRRGVTQTVYLPGDREATMLADAVRRDSHLTWRERQAASLAADCSRRKYFYSGEWKCTRESPCCYCRDIG